MKINLSPETLGLIKGAKELNTDEGEPRPPKRQNEFDRDSTKRQRITSKRSAIEEQRKAQMDLLNEALRFQEPFGILHPQNPSNGLLHIIAQDLTGVSWHKHSGRFKGQIRVKGKRVHAGYASNPFKVAYKVVLKLQHTATKEDLPEAIREDLKKRADSLLQTLFEKARNFYSMPDQTELTSLEHPSLSESSTVPVFQHLKQNITTTPEEEAAYALMSLRQAL